MEAEYVLAGRQVDRQVLTAAHGAQPSVVHIVRAGGWERMRPPLPARRDPQLSQLSPSRLRNRYSLHADRMRQLKRPDDGRLEA